MITRFVMQLVLFILAVVGGYSVAGWIGAGVAVAFIVTLYIDLAMRMRSPKARIMRQIAHDLRHVTDEDLIVARVTKVEGHDPNCRHHAHPIDPAPADED